MCRIRLFFRYAVYFNVVVKQRFNFNIFNRHIHRWTNNNIHRTKKTIRATISFKCINSIKLNFTDLTCIFFSFTIFLWAIIFRFLNIAFTFSIIMSRNICRKNSKEISSNSRNRILIEVFNICLMMLTKFDYFLNIWTNLLNESKISNVSNEILTLIYLILWYFVARNFKLISMIILIISILLTETACLARFKASK